MMNRPVNSNAGGPDPQGTEECVWNPEDPGNEFFFTTGCGERGVNKEDSYKFCPYCGKPMHIQLATDLVTS